MQAEEDGFIRRLLPYFYFKLFDMQMPLFSPTAAVVGRTTTRNINQDELFLFPKKYLEPGADRDSVDSLVLFCYFTECISCRQFKRNFLAYEQNWPHHQ